MPICGSPWLIAAYRVFHRLPVPRHSPCALCSLTMHFPPPQTSAHGNGLSCYDFRLIVVLPIITNVTLLYLFSQLLLSLFNFQGAERFVKSLKKPLLRSPGFLNLSIECSHFFFAYFFLFAKKKVSGGHKWTRTTDLALIRRAL